MRSEAGPAYPFAFGTFVFASRIFDSFLTPSVVVLGPPKIESCIAITCAVESGEIGLPIYYVVPLLCKWDEERTTVEFVPAVSTAHL